MLKYVFLLVIHLSASALIAQSLPKNFAAGEREAMPQYLANTIKEAKTGRSGKLDFPVRSMAEWEELSGLIISWDNGFKDIQAEIVRNTIPQCKIIIACTNASTVKSFLESKGISDSVNVQYVIGKYNSIWVRDYGPNTVYARDVDSFYLVDWIYNRPRYQDDTLARQLSRSLQLPLIETNEAPLDLVHTGGNYMSDGLGTAFSSLLVMDENGPNSDFGFSDHTEAEVDTIMHDFMGTKVYPKMNTLPYDAIHHIDMHMKILDEQTILVGKYPNDVADGKQINANIDYVLSNFTNTFGKPYRIVYMPMPPGPNGKYPDQNGNYRTYTNSVFVNKTVLVPFYAEQYDTIARRIYEEALPGYNIVGIDCNKIIPSLGAIHCITKEVGVNDPLMIAVDAILPIIDAKVTVERDVHAIVKNRTGIEKVMLYYQLEEVTELWDSIEMNIENNLTSLYIANIPEFKNTARYFIKGFAKSGKTITRPMTAPSGFYTSKTLQTSSSNEINSTNHIEVYPNPATSMTLVDVHLSSRDRIHIGLYDAAGKMVKTLFNGNYQPNQQKLFFDASAFLPGVYFIKAEGKNQLNIVPLVVN